MKKKNIVLFVAEDGKEFDSESLLWTSLIM